MANKRMKSECHNLSSRKSVWENCKVNSAPNITEVQDKPLDKIVEDKTERVNL